VRLFDAIEHPFGIEDDLPMLGNIPVADVVTDPSTFPGQSARSPDVLDSMAEGAEWPVHIEASQCWLRGLAIARHDMAGIVEMVQPRIRR